MQRRVWIHAHHALQKWYCLVQNDTLTIRESSLNIGRRTRRDGMRRNTSYEQRKRCQQKIRDNRETEPCTENNSPCTEASELEVRRIFPPPCPKVGLDEGLGRGLAVAPPALPPPPPASPPDVEKVAATTVEGGISGGTVDTDVIVTRALSTSPKKRHKKDEGTHFGYGTKYTSTTEPNICRIAQERNRKDSDRKEQDTEQHTQQVIFRSFKQKHPPSMGSSQTETTTGIRLNG